MNKFKNLLLMGTIAASPLALYPVQAADVGVSVSVGQPGFYGHIDIGDYPQPEVVYAEPIIIHRQAEVVYEPIYLRVPPGQQKRWSRYCGSYAACSRPVYFVQDRWYNDVYAPRYREHHGDDHGDYDDDHGRGGDHDGGERGHRGHGRNH